MRVGFLSQPFDYAGPPDPGSSLGIWTWETARRLVRSCQVLIVASRVRGGPAIEKWEGVHFRRFALTADHYLRSITARRFGGLAGRVEAAQFLLPAYYPIYARRAAWAFHREGCDVVIIHNFSQFVPIVRSANPRAKIVLHMTADWLVQFDYDVVNARLRQADAIVGCSEYVTGRIQKAFPQYADRCLTVFPGVDVGEIARRAARPADHRGARVVFVGRVSPEKGLHVLIDAFERVLEKRPQSHLEIIGGEFVTPIEFTVGISDDPIVRGLSRFYNGSYLKRLRDQVRGKLTDRVTFLSYLPRVEMLEHLKQADVFVQPSIASEMFGIAVAEAMAAGVPVVATRICGLPELVADGETGFLVDRDDPEMLAEAIIHLLEDSNLSGHMGDAGRARVEQLFTWDQTTEALQNAFISEHARVNDDLRRAAPR